MPDIVNGQRGEPPKLFPPDKLVCLEGRRRCQAALKIKSDMWWTARLNVCLVLREIAASGGDEDGWSDGDVYRRVHQCKDEADIPDDLKSKLSDYKQDALERLLDQPRFCAVRDGLLAFPGLFVGLELGNIEKDIALRSLDEIKNGAQNISDVWHRITLGATS